MPTTTSLIKDVVAEFSEYVGTVNIDESGDAMEIELNAPFVIDQVLFNSTTGNVYRVDLVYPSSEASVELKSASASGDWALNDGNSNGVMWFKTPARTKIRLSTETFSASEALSLVVVGRGA